MYMETNLEPEIKEFDEVLKSADLLAGTGLAYTPYKRKEDDS